MISKKFLHKQIERILKVRIIRNIPHGIDLSFDIKKVLPAFHGQMIFDVGSNIGQSTSEYLDIFPYAHIHCFEPIESTFTTLKKRFENNSRVSCWRLAMGSDQSTVLMSKQYLSSVSHVLSSERDPCATNNEIEQVQSNTVSAFCSRMNIRYIDFLKIDTEGHDLEVLKGAEELLQIQSIDLVQVEAGIHSNNTVHVQFDKFINFMENRNYHVFGIYNQALEWPTAEPRLRRVDIVFISESTVRRNKQSGNSECVQGL